MKMSTEMQLDLQQERKLQRQRAKTPEPLKEEMRKDSAKSQAEKVQK